MHNFQPYFSYVFDILFPHFHNLFTILLFLNKLKVFG